MYTLVNQVDIISLTKIESNCSIGDKYVQEKLFPGSLKFPFEVMHLFEPAIHKFIKVV